MDDRAVTRSALIVNPSSGKASGKGLALAHKLQHHLNVTVNVLERFELLPAIINELAGKGVTDLFISSGDGTIQAIQTDLAERRPFKTLPRLGLLSHGTTNMTAADLGFRHRSLDAQAAFIANPQTTELRHRPTLRAANPRDGRPRHGMFLGTGAISKATLFCQQAFNAKGVKGDWATFATLAGAVSRLLFTAADPADQSRFDRPYPIEVTADGKSYATGEQLLLLSTTLNKLILGTKPFWGGKQAPIRTSILPYPVPNIARWLVPVMYGGEMRKVPQGAISFASGSLDITTPITFVIDGEFFEPPESEALRVETGPVFTYIRG